MKTFTINVLITGKITVPDNILRDLRNLAAEDPKAEGGDVFLNALHQRTYENDDEFLQGALKNALRNIARNGIIQDIAGMGVGIKAAPAAVEVSVPERVVTRIGSKEQVAIDPVPEFFDTLTDRFSGPEFADGPVSEGFATDTPYNAAHSAALAGDINLT